MASQMLVEYADRPVAIGTRVPRFSWEVPLAGRRRRQSAYQVLVASDASLLEVGEADLWDSGKVGSAQSVNVEYAGAALRSNMDCVWALQVWDETGEPSGFSEPEPFGTALFDAADWEAEWIGLGAPDEAAPAPACYQQESVPAEVQALEPDSRAPMLRKVFELTHPVRRARAFVCGVGLHELSLNGAKVGDEVLSTPRTEFRERLIYMSYDVTDHLVPGENAIGLMLGNGWFNGQKKYWGWQYQWYGSPRAIAQLEIDYEDGSRQRVCSDDSWQGDFSPITFNCIYDGEDYDARLEQNAWDTAGFDAGAWDAVNTVPSPGGDLAPATHEAEQVVERFPPVSVCEPEPGVFVYDMGRNITGWVRLRVKGGAAGDVVTLSFGEAQQADGALNASSNNGARQQDLYTLKGSGEECFEPRFTFHGFQFVELRGCPGSPDLETLEACFVRTAVAQTGAFECADDSINKIHRCTLQSQLCNVQMGVPTDDTQRSERLGWGADAWGTATEALYNLWMPRVYQKWIADFRDQQDESGMVGMIAPQAGAEEDLVWSAAFILIPWWQYLHCGDRRILEENYAALDRYMNFLGCCGVKDVGTQTSGEVIDSILWRCGEGNRFPDEADRGYLQIAQWGDHLATAEGSGSRCNLPLSMATAFYYLDATVMAQIAEVLGKDDDVERYRALGGSIKEAYNARFFDPSVGYYDSGVQSAQAWPLAFGLVDEVHVERVSRYFARSVEHVQRHLTTGYCGTKFAINTLSMLGRDDLVWKLASSTEYPSWKHMLRNGRTTSCEQWNGDDGSLNHAPLGAAIDEWFYSGLAGIQPDPSGPGFERIIIKPHLPADLAWVKASLQTARGRVASAWEHDGTTARLRVTVPANCSATVQVPTADGERVRLDGESVAAADGVEGVASDADMCSIEIGSGEYEFSFPMGP